MGVINFISFTGDLLFLIFGCYLYYMTYLNQKPNKYNDTNEKWGRKKRRMWKILWIFIILLSLDGVINYTVYLAYHFMKQGAS